MTDESSNLSSNQKPESASASEESAAATKYVRCALTGEAVPAQEAYWAPPLITARQLLETVFTTVLRNPGNLGQVLFSEPENVPYAPHAREELGKRRSQEQIKLLGLMLLVAIILLALVVALIGPGNLALV